MGCIIDLVSHGTFSDRFFIEMALSLRGLCLTKPNNFSLAIRLTVEFRDIKTTLLTQPACFCAYTDVASTLPTSDVSGARQAEVLQPRSRRAPQESDQRSSYFDLLGV